MTKKLSNNHLPLPQILLSMSILKAQQTNKQYYDGPCFLGSYPGMHASVCLCVMTPF